MTTKEKSVEEILTEFQKLSLTFVVGEGVIEHHAKLSNFFLETLQAERQRCEDVVEALQAIERMCDGNNPAHEEIWHTAYSALQALTQPNNK